MLLHNLTSSLLPGQMLYKYELRKRIGSGTFGEVWLALDHAVNREYALKILEPGISVDERLREARIGNRLNHHNVVRIHQADVTNLGPLQYAVLAMDYIENGPVTTLANPSGYLTLPEVVRIGRDMLRGLEYLHQHDLIHNDIKPQNVLIGSDGRGMLTDYGIVGVSQGGAPIPTSMFYKLHAAPEVIEENIISPRSDIYQVGLTMFRLLVGIGSLGHKFDELGEQNYYSAVTSSRLLKSKDFPAYVPHRLRRVIMRAAHVDANSRYSSAIQMRRDLEKFQCPGFWTVTKSGDFLGRNGGYIYRFEQNTTANGKYNVRCYKKNVSSGRETQCLKYCHGKLTSALAKKEIEKFVLGVVMGTV